MTIRSCTQFLEVTSYLESCPFFYLGIFSYRCRSNITLIFKSSMIVTSLTSKTRIRSSSTGIGVTCHNGQNDCGNNERVDEGKHHHHEDVNQFRIGRRLGTTAGCVPGLNTLSQLRHDVDRKQVSMNGH